MKLFGFGSSLKLLEHTEELWIPTVECPDFQVNEITFTVLVNNFSNSNFLSINGLLNPKKLTTSMTINLFKKSLGYKETVS